MSKLNLTVLLLDAPFSTEYGEPSEIKYVFIPIDGAIFN
jgi:hypothetical protein